MARQQRPHGHRPKQQEEERRLGFDIEFERDGKIAPQLFDETAREVAREVARVVAGGKREANTNKSTQLRRFYDELVMWHGKARQQPEQFEAYLPMIRMLKAKAAYAKGRKLVDGAFLDMVEQTIDYIDSKERLDTAKLFFEAFIGFYKLEKGD